MIAPDETLGDARKLCRACIYCQPSPADHDEDTWTLAVCVRAPMFTDLVVGIRKHPFCENERANLSGCGPAGRNYKPKP